MKQTIDKNKLSIWLQTKGLSTRSIEEYLYYYNKFDFNFTQDNINQFLVNNDNSIGRAFLSNLIEYINTADIIKEFKDHIKLNITIPKRTGRKAKKIPDVITKDQAISIANAMNRERNSLMVVVSFYGGLRVSEVIGIKPYDFNWNTWTNKPEEQGRLKITGKGNKQRYIFIPQKIMQRLYKWIKQYISQGQSKDDPLFQIGRRRWATILAEASQKAIGKAIHPHTLRHGCGSWLRDNGWDLKEIAEYLGHESILTTQIYTHISQSKLKDKFKKLTE